MSNWWQQAATAGAIAAGDLSRRVETTDPGTEVGALGRALNTILGQIERSFDARLASEASMRRIEEEAARMGTLVDELLLLASLDETRRASARWSAIC